MILDAAIPLIVEHGRDVTTKQIAEAAGIAEGTVFRAFEDKEDLCRAAVSRFMDPEPIRATLKAIDPADPLEAKLTAVVDSMRERFSGLLGILHALRVERHPAGHAKGEHRAEMEGMLASLLDADRESLRFDPEVAARLVRMVVFSSVMSPFRGDDPVATEDLVDFIVNGIGRKDG